MTKDESDLQSKKKNCHTVCRSIKGKYSDSLAKEFRKALIWKQAIKGFIIFGVIVC